MKETASAQRTSEADPGIQTEQPPARQVIEHCRVEIFDGATRTFLGKKVSKKVIDS